MDMCPLTIAAAFKTAVAGGTTPDQGMPSTCPIGMFGTKYDVLLAGAPVCGAGWQGWLMGGVGCGSEERVGKGMHIGPHGTFIRGPPGSASVSIVQTLRQALPLVSCHKKRFWWLFL